MPFESQAGTGDCVASRQFNQLMYERECQIHEDILDFTRSSDMFWLNDVAFPSATWTDGEGYVREKVRHHGIPNQLTVEESWENVEQRVDNNTVPKDDPAWNPDLATSGCESTCNDLAVGLEKFTYRPKKSCLRGEPICSEDIRHAWMFDQIMQKHTRSYAMNAMEHKANWNRDIYLTLAQRYPAIDGYAGLEPTPGALPSLPPGGLLPMSIGLLEQKFEEMYIRFDDFAVGRTSDGQPIYLVVMDPLDMTAVLRDQYGSDYAKYGDAASNFVEGITGSRAYGNWSFRGDKFAKRYIEDPLNPGQLQLVKPWIDDPAKANITGSAVKINPAWQNAPYGEAVVYMQGVFQNRIFPTITSVAGASFGTSDNGLVEWDGKPKWARIQSDCDPFGMTGRYYMHFKRAPEPMDNEGAFSIIYSRCPTNAPLLECTQKTCQETLGSCTPVAAVFACAANGNDYVVTSSQDLGFTEGAAYTVTTDLGGVATTLTAVDLTDGFVYTFTAGVAADCGAGIVSIVAV